MKNVYLADGLSKMYVASIISAVAIIVAFIPYVGFFPVASIAILVAGIINLVGLHGVGEQIAEAEVAFWLSIANIILGIIVDVVSYSFPVMGLIFAVIRQIISCAVIYLICRYVASEVDLRDGGAIEKLGNITIFLSITELILSVLISIVTLVLAAYIDNTIWSETLTSVNLVVELVSAVCYVIFLKRTSEYF